MLEFNPAAERVFGYTRAQAVGQEMAELIIPPFLRERHRRGLAHYLATGEGPVLDVASRSRPCARDGSEILVELAITTFRIDGVPVFTAYFAMSRSGCGPSEDARPNTRSPVCLPVRGPSRKRADDFFKQLPAVESGSPLLFGYSIRGDETLHCACTWHAADEKLKLFDQITRQTRFKRSIGLPGRVVESGKPTWIRDVMQDQDFPRAEVAAQSGLRGAFAFPLFADGEVNGVIEMFGHGPFQPDDDLLQMVESLGNQIGLFIHRQEMEKELQQEKENAEAANASKDRFLATLSHELRTPLTPVLVWAGGMSKQADLPADLVEGLEMVCRNVELEARLIDDLLDLTRIARGKLQLDLRPTDAHELVRHAMDIVRADISARQINVLIALDAPTIMSWSMPRVCSRPFGICSATPTSSRAIMARSPSAQATRCRGKFASKLAIAASASNSSISRKFSTPSNKSVAAGKASASVWPSAKPSWKCTAERYLPKVKAWEKARSS